MVASTDNPHAWEQLAAQCYTGLEGAALALKRSSLAFAYRWLSMTCITGQVENGVSASIVIAGSSPALAALQGQLMPVVESRCELGTYPLVVLASRLGLLATHADLVVARVERGATPILGCGALWVPELVDGVIALPATDTPLRLSPSARDNATRIHKSELTYRISREAADLDLLSRRYYVPHSKSAHGPRASLRSPRTLWAAFLRGGILWVERHNERVAGLLFSVAREELSLVAFGVRDGDLSLRGCGASSAVTLFALEHATKLGLRSLNLGGSLPWLADPILQSKRFWGASLRQRSRITHDLLLSWPAGSRAAAALVSRLGPIHRERGRLIALTDGDPVGLERMRMSGLEMSHAAAARRPEQIPASREVVEAIRRVPAG